MDISFNIDSDEKILYQCGISKSVLRYFLIKAICLIVIYVAILIFFILSEAVILTILFFALFAMISAKNIKRYFVNKKLRYYVTTKKIIIEHSGVSDKRTTFLLIDDIKGFNVAKKKYDNFGHKVSSIDFLSPSIRAYNCFEYGFYHIDEQDIQNILREVKNLMQCKTNNATQNNT